MDMVPKKIVKPGQDHVTISPPSLHILMRDPTVHCLLHHQVAHYPSMPVQARSTTSVWKTRSGPKETRRKLDRTNYFYPSIY